MSGSLDVVAIGPKFEYAVLGVQVVLFHTLHGAFVHGAVMNQIGNGADLEVCLLYTSDAADE